MQVKEILDGVCVCYSLSLTPPHTHSLLSSKVQGVRERVADILKLKIKTIKSGELQGQKALWRELNKQVNN